MVGTSASSEQDSVAAPIEYLDCGSLPGGKGIGQVYDMIVPIKYHSVALAVPEGSDSKYVNILHTHEKPPMYDLDKVGYLWGKPSEPLSHIEHEELGKAEEIVAYGLHTYGGYYGFFRPDLNEVIRLALHAIKDIDSVKKIYVTTEMHPSENVADCYDVKKDRHRAKTTFWVLRKE